MQADVNALSSMVSVIVPVYNIATYLNKCVDSILSQSYENIEVILVNDGSTDNSGKICDAYAIKDNRVIVIHKNNQGVSSARNDGLTIAKGEYISFVDGDDYCHQNMIQILINEMKKYDADLIICNINSVWNDGRVEVHGNYENKIFNEIKNFGNYFADYYGISNIIASPWNKLYKKEIVCTFKDGMNYGEDLIFVFDCLRKCKKILTINQPLYNYQHFNDTSATKKYRPDYINIWVDRIDAIKVFCKDVFSSDFDMNKLNFVLCLEIEAVIRYYTKHKIKYTEKLIKIKEGMKNPVFIEIIKKTKYKPKGIKMKIKYYAAKIIIQNKMPRLFVLYSFFINR